MISARSAGFKIVVIVPVWKDPQSLPRTLLDSLKAGAGATVRKPLRLLFFGVISPERCTPQVFLECSRKHPCPGLHLDRLLIQLRRLRRHTSRGAGIGPIHRKV